MPDFWIPPHAAAELAQTRRYTADEMVALAQEHRYKATIPLLYDWMRLGLIGKPEEGERGRWKPQQASLWLKLLETREQPKVHIVHLCNLPVGGWIFFGERMGGVSRAQIQRVMRTWAERQRRPSLEQVRRAVQRLVKLTKTRDAQQVLHAKKQLNELLAHEGLDVVGLRDPLILLMEGRKPEKRGQTKGPQGAAFSVETLLTLWETRERAIRNMAAFDDWMWEWARMAFLFGMHQYQQEYPWLAQEAWRFPELRELFRVETLTTLVSNACMDLATLLEIAYEDARQVPPCPPIPGLPAPLQMPLWRDGAVWGEVNSSVALDQHLGLPTTALQMAVAIHRVGDPTTLGTRDAEREVLPP